MAMASPLKHDSLTTRAAALVKVPLHSGLAGARYDTTCYRFLPQIFRWRGDIAFRLFRRAPSCPAASCRRTRRQWRRLLDDADAGRRR